MPFVPLSFGIPLGSAVALVGATLFFVTKRKRVAAAIFGVGLIIIVGTVALMGLTLSSMP